jgi:hypothetical protein
MTIQINTVQAKECLIDAIKAKIVPILKGSPGIGKSAIINEIAEEFNLFPIDFRLAQSDPCDLLGFPDINRQTGKASYIPMDIFPLEGATVPKGYDGWLLFLDEANSADKAVQKAAYKLMLDRMVGNVKLHSKVAIVAAGNLETDNAIVEEMSTALQSRLAHYELIVDAPTWLEWAMSNGIHHYVTSFIKWKPSSLHNFRPDSPDVTYACPRTWEFASRFLYQRDLSDPLLLVNLIGVLGEGMAREFLGYCKVYGQLPSAEEILKAPNLVEVPEDRSILWAITGSIASWVKETTVDKFMEYVCRFPKEFQFVCLKEMVRRNQAMGSTPAVSQWISINAAELW